MTLGRSAETPPSLAAFCEVVVPLPLEGTFSYHVPDHLRGALEIGHRVLVPFGKRNLTGFVSALRESPPATLDLEKIKDVLRRLDAEPLLPEDLLELTHFAARYYLAAPGEVLKVAIPPSLTRGSVIRFKITKKGRAALSAAASLLFDAEAALSPAEQQLLEAATHPLGLKPAPGRRRIALSLEKRGLLREVFSNRPLDMGGEIELVSLAEPKTSPQLEATLGNSRTKQRLREVLALGPRPIAEVVSALRSRSARTILQDLAKKKVIEIRSLPAEQVPRSVLEALNGTATAEAEFERGEWPNIELTEEQQQAVEQIVVALNRQEPKTFLLQGVTGSGKTEIYLHAIRHVRQAHRGAIVLVPEIALTPQLEARFKERFGADVVVLHSQVAGKERRERWQRLRRGEASIALGARSAIWAPVQRLGIIVVDEEHDPSFKQSSELRYSGKDLALARAKMTGSVVILGSATPSIESMHLAREGRFQEIRLTSRVQGRPMPTIEVVDLSEERRVMKRNEVLSRKMIDRLREIVDRSQQAILFLNRRGFNTIVFCEGCGDARDCPHCDISLTHHKSPPRLQCHHCGFSERVESPCRSCGTQAMVPFGAGTERVADAVIESVPGARVLRLDRDVTAKRGSLAQTLDAFRRQEANILVGTQMVAKGHDFPRVTLVGIVLADASLALPDFRSGERTFQLLTQVAGRAGRASEAGHVVIQTFSPDHYAIACALAHDADRFFEIECNPRKKLGYPPFMRIGLIRAESKHEKRAEVTAGRAHHLAARITREMREGVVRGPISAPIAKVKDRFRFMVMLSASTPAKLVSVMSRVKRELKAEPRVDVVFDIDPVDLL